LLVPVGADTYAIELSDVREVVDAPALTAVPTAPSCVLGLCNLRGEVVVVLDTGVLLGSEPAGELAAVVIVDSSLGTAGLSATGETRTADLGEPVSASRGPAGRGRFRVGDELVTLLELTDVIAAAHGPVS
jgi:purine-binding chemotaxis protein CheW